MRGIRLVVAAAVASTVVAFAAGLAQAAPAKKLAATVGPGFTITLVDAKGRKVTRLKAGRYVITVRDRSDIHNFALSGPGVDQATSVPVMGTVKWTLVLRKGTYTYVCDPHLSMQGSFVVT